MSDAIIVALIGLIGSGVGAFGGILVSSKLMQYRLEQLEKKVDEHNQLIDRFYKLKERVGLDEEKLRVTSTRLDDFIEDSK